METAKENTRGNSEISLVYYGYLYTSMVDDVLCLVLDCAGKEGSVFPGTREWGKWPLQKHLGSLHT